jgi:FKBP-type peptidyl-prolyl cis-trans isomerase 2
MLTPSPSESMTVLFVILVIFRNRTIDGNTVKRGVKTGAIGIFTVGDYDSPRMVDFNHLLAGKTLIFDVKVKDINAAEDLSSTQHQEMNPLICASEVTRHKLVALTSPVTIPPHK